MSLFTLTFYFSILIFLEISGIGIEKSPRSLVKQPLRLVQIDNKTSSCPNCLGKLSPLFLDSADRERVRVGLINIAHSRAPHHATSIQVEKHFKLSWCHK
jgi:uncharacterized protein (UPF0212 family)